MDEIWKDVVGYEPRYQVSNLGRVKSKERSVNHYCAGSRFVKSKILKEQTNWAGYKRVALYDENGRVKKFSIHRLVLGAFIGESDLQIDHIDMDKGNNKLSNLEYVSPRENMLRAKGNLINRDLPSNINITRAGNYSVFYSENKERNYLGTFKTLEEAENALKTGRKKRFKRAQSDMPKGVIRVAGKFRSYYWQDGKTHTVGTFCSVEQAVEALRLARDPS